MPDDAKRPHERGGAADADEDGHGPDGAEVEADQEPTPDGTQVWSPGGGPGGGGPNALKAVGPYRILERLGQGGMGDVYLAEQTEPLRRKVALKVIRRGLDTEAFVRRFETERQALALMEHPSIARVFDAGATEDGRPYYVMEWVQGTRIDEYADARRLGVRERVALFVQVCRAVQHAHQKGIIHRDLKPSNVLVTEDDGRPLAKVIDFGIAKAMTQDGEDLTQADDALGTPAYMSPEQAGVGTGDVDTRTDVYALGAMLYRLLTGLLPFEARYLSPYATALETLRTQEPARPSRRLLTSTGNADEVAQTFGVALPVLRRELERELDWIVLKAMEKDRDRRYETATGLAMDLERFLNDEPVRARPPSRAYVAGKFVRRHRAGVVAAAAMLAAVVASGFWITARSREAGEREAAEHLREFVERLVQGSDPAEGPGEGSSLIEVVAWAIDQWADSRPRNPWAEAALRENVAGPLLRERNLEASWAQVDRGEELARAVYGSESVHLASFFELRAQLEREQNNLDSAAAHIDRAVALLDRASDGAELASDVAQDILTTAANVSMSRGEWERAQGYLFRSLDTADSAAATETWNLIGRLREEQADFEGARAAYERAVGLLRSLPEEERARFNAFEGTLLNNLSAIHASLGNDTLAAAVGGQALTILRRQFVGADEPRISLNVLNQANRLRAVGSIEEATALYEESLGLHQSRYGLEHREYAWAASSMGSFLATHTDRHDEGLSLTTLALDIINDDPWPPGEAWVGAMMQVFHGRALIASGYYAEAELYLTEGVSIYQEGRPADVRRINEYRSILVNLYDQMGEAEKAAEVRALIDASGEPGDE